MADDQRHFLSSCSEVVALILSFLPQQSWLELFRVCVAWAEAADEIAEVHFRSLLLAPTANSDDDGSLQLLAYGAFAPATDCCAKFLIESAIALQLVRNLERRCGYGAFPIAGDDDVQRRLQLVASLRRLRAAMDTMVREHVDDAAKRDLGSENLVYAVRFFEERDRLVRFLGKSTTAGGTHPVHDLQRPAVYACEIGRAFCWAVTGVDPNVDGVEKPPEAVARRRWQSFRHMLSSPHAAHWLQSLDPSTLCSQQAASVTVAQMLGLEKGCEGAALPTAQTVRDPFTVFRVDVNEDSAAAARRIKSRRRCPARQLCGGLMSSSFVALRDELKRSALSTPRRLIDMPYFDLLRSGVSFADVQVDWLPVIQAPKPSTTKPVAPAMRPQPVLDEAAAANISVSFDAFRAAYRFNDEDIAYLTAKFKEEREGRSKTVFMDRRARDQRGFLDTTNWFIGHMALASQQHELMFSAVEAFRDIQQPLEFIHALLCRLELLDPSKSASPVALHQQPRNKKSLGLRRGLPGKQPHLRR